MTNSECCTHADVDQLGPVCLHCGRVKWPSPFAVVIVGACLYFLAQMIRWHNAGWRIIGCVFPVVK